MEKNLFKKCLFILILVVLAIIVAVIMLKYDKEGEKKMPFSISKILLVSTASGNAKDDGLNIWNIDIDEVNDVYIFINRMDESEDVIKEIKIDSFTVNTAPQKGELKIYRPTGELSNLYTHSEQNYLEDSITYLGGQIDDMKNLEIANTGGIIGFRAALENLGNFVSNETQEINYDGTLFSHLGIGLDDIKFNISFDIIIKTGKDISYKGTLNLDMPVETIMTEKESNKEITDFSDVVFKRM